MHAQALSSDWLNQMLLKLQRFFMYLIEFCVHVVISRYQMYMYRKKSQNHVHARGQ